jgi:hypothetical protein
MKYSSIIHDEVDIGLIVLLFERCILGSLTLRTFAELEVE